jgi:MscS family membrane protein
MHKDLLQTSTIWLKHNNTEIFYNLLLSVAVLFVINLLVWITSKLMQKHLAKRRSVWLQSVFYSLRLPAGVFIWVAGLSYSLFIELNSPVEDAALRVISLTFIACVTWTILKMVNFAEKKYYIADYAKSKQQRETISAIARFIKVIVVIIGIIVLLQNLGVSVSGLVAFGGVGAAGVAFAARDILGNLFGGLMIFFNRPFSIGDWIRSPDKEIEGSVEQIGWLLTRIRTFDKRPLYVPNGIFSTIAIENPQRMLNRRIKETIGLRYQDANKIAKITSDIKMMLTEHKAIDQNQTIIVDLVKFNNSSLDILVYTFTKTTDWITFQDIQQDVFLKILEIIEANGAECAFPTTTWLPGKQQSDE